MEILCFNRRYFEYDFIDCRNKSENFTVKYCLLKINFLKLRYVYEL